ncbi:esterase OVCA2 isoform X2 [Latimeria chalumnae]|uniref:Esterase OVCA2 n=2 Tax=Latimeria chalumnae TaxID=7897 RepID=H3AM14_LATCH|nr:PREDICTED: ovarian cancer-associated gene 2 protein isoform X2 [Latimeria chalumnae]|eukprot:XP_006007486.1 PREDICTED: ovarian cancer-associated gene 2 protein isoform X2 [Latimeria chalumnae]
MVGTLLWRTRCLREGFEGETPKLKEEISSRKMAPGLLRLLCIHGYRQNETTFRERTGSLRKILKKHAELVYITAPLQVTPPPGALPGDTDPGGAVHVGDPNGQMADPRGWWFSDPERESFNALEQTKSCKGLEESLETVAKALADQGPFNGILGFSQGSALVAIICALKQQGDLRFQFDFAILIAGFKSQSSSHESYYRDPITIPTLHIFGETDRVIPGEMSRDLTSCFTDPLVLTHQGGHFVPTSAPQKKVYCEFLGTFLKKE